MDFWRFFMDFFMEFFGGFWGIFKKKVRQKIRGRSSRRPLSASTDNIGNSNNNLSLIICPTAAT